MKYLFILGNNPELSQEEIKAVLPLIKIIKSGKNFLIVEQEKIDCQQIINRLGGTIKIGTFLSNNFNINSILKIANQKTNNKRFNFGFSFYQQKPTNVGMVVKRKLAEAGINSRLVTSRDSVLSSVIIIKEKCHDFLIGPNFFGLTCAVQNFKDYTKRDFGRPAFDALSGMLPPKVAKMMINLSQTKKNQIILDPFCGSGTILTEALALGYQNLLGTDLSAKAVADSLKNLQWLSQELKINKINWKVSQLNVEKLSEKFKENSIDAIISEPYLGKPIKGNETEKTIKQIIKELEKLYLTSFIQFKKILKPQGKIIIIIPEWHLNNKIYQLNFDKQLAKLNLQRLDNNQLIYKREKQKVWRKITIWKKP